MGLRVLIAFFVLINSHYIKAESTVGYFGFEPDIITNYIGGSKKVGYVRVSVNLKLIDVAHIGIIEHHTPFLRDSIIQVLSREPEEAIKSLTGRERIRKTCEEKVKKLLKLETGQEIIDKLIFTTYLYH